MIYSLDYFFGIILFFECDQYNIWLKPSLHNYLGIYLISTPYLLVCPNYNNHIKMQYVDIRHSLKNRDTAERLRVAKYEHKIVDPINYTTNNVIVFIYVSIVEQKRYDYFDFYIYSSFEH